MSLSASTVPSEFIVIDFDSDDLSGAVSGSNTSITLTADNNVVIIKPKCPEAVIQQVSFVTQNVVNGSIVYLDNTESVLFKKMVCLLPAITNLLLFMVLHGPLKSPV